MLLQNLHRHYLYIVIRLPKLKDLEHKIIFLIGTIMVYIDHLTQIQPVMMLNLIIMHCISKYAPVLRLTT